MKKTHLFLVLSNIYIVLYDMKKISKKIANKKIKNISCFIKYLCRTLHYENFSQISKTQKITKIRIHQKIPKFQLSNTSKKICKIFKQTFFICLYIINKYLSPPALHRHLLYARKKRTTKKITNNYNQLNNYKYI